MPAEHLTRWIDDLRTADAVFAEASRLRDPDDTAWQAAVYLLSSDERLWRRFGPVALREQSLTAVTIEALAAYGYDYGRRKDPAIRATEAWGPDQLEVLAWTAFLATGRWFDGPATVPWALDSVRFERWLTALWIRRHDPIAPEVPAAAPSATLAALAH
ncbi:hypothetical protein [Patulibacter minatonensis]|uniref:hypothetical protein n=1 Tax=Patulibacter minatonensis TaxID=298163 RepID=UPI0004BC1BF7|nr:hypothetical protein [Patulibacter minatonensis]